MANSERPRPYWQVDVKWIFGILFTAGLFFSTLLYSLSVATSQKVFVPMASYFVATQFSRNGLDDAKEIDELKKKFSASQKEIRPIPQSDVVITQDDVENLTPRQIRLKIFEQVVNPIYMQKRTSETMKQYGFLAFLNYESNKIISDIFKISLIPLVVSGVGLFWFSYKHGKFISFAIAFLLNGVLPATFLYTLKLSSAKSGTTTFPVEIVSAVVPALLKVYGGLTFAGFVLILGAFIATKVERSRTVLK